RQRRYEERNSKLQQKNGVMDIGGMYGVNVVRNGGVRSWNRYDDRLLPDGDGSRGLGTIGYEANRRYRQDDTGPIDCGGYVQGTRRPQRQPVGRSRPGRRISQRDKSVRRGRERQAGRHGGQACRTGNGDRSDRYAGIG